MVSVDQEFRLAHCGELIFAPQYLAPKWKTSRLAAWKGSRVGGLDSYQDWTKTRACVSKMTLMAAKLEIVQ